MRRAHLKLLLKARRFNATLVGSDDVPFAALAEREGVSPSYFTRLVRLSYLAPDITHAILDGRQPRDLTAEKLLAHSRLLLAWHDQRAALGLPEPGPNSKTIQPKSGSWVIATMGRIGAFDGHEHNSFDAFTSPGG